MASACAVLMPDHVHLVHFGDPKLMRVALVKLIAAFARFRGKVRGWNVPAPEPIVQDKVWRQLRYVHLNPCRAGLASDPLSWPFSTHRDAIGATYNPWLCLDQLQAVTHEFGSTMRQQFHAYVSADPSVHPAGTIFPQPAPARPRALMGLEQIRQAALAASPWCDAARQRERIVMLALHQGWHSAAAVAETAGVTSRHVCQIWRRARAIDLTPAALCLGDTRLRTALRAPKCSGPRY